MFAVCNIWYNALGWRYFLSPICGFVFYKEMFWLFQVPEQIKTRKKQAGNINPMN